MNSRSFKVLEMSDNTQGTGDMDSDKSSASRSKLESVRVALHERLGIPRLVNTDHHRSQSAGDAAGVKPGYVDDDFQAPLSKS